LVLDGFDASGALGLAFVSGRFHVHVRL